MKVQKALASVRERLREHHFASLGMVKQYMRSALLFTQAGVV
jgi:hypothetical protein